MKQLGRSRSCHDQMVKLFMSERTILDPTLSINATECRSGLWDSEEAIWLLQQYLVRPEHWTDPRFAVIRANLKGLPSATVITCEVDFLRDEGKDYAEKLKVRRTSCYLNSDPEVYQKFV